MIDSRGLQQVANCVLSTVRSESKVHLSSTSCLLGAGDAYVEQVWVLWSGNQSQGMETSKTTRPAMPEWPQGRKIGPRHFLGVPPRAAWNFPRERQSGRKGRGRAFESRGLTSCRQANVSSSSSLFSSLFLSQGRGRDQTGGTSLCQKPEVSRLPPPHLTELLPSWK